MIVIKDNILETEQEDLELSKRLDSIKQQHPKLILNLQRDFLIEREQAESRFWHEVEAIKAKAKQKEETILRVLVESEDKRGGIIAVAEQSNTSTLNKNDVPANINNKKYIANPEDNDTSKSDNNIADSKHKYY